MDTWQEWAYGLILLDMMHWGMGHIQLARADILLNQMSICIMYYTDIRQHLCCNMDIMFLNVGAFLGFRFI